MLSFILLSFIFNTISGSPTDWNGKFDDPIWGGKLAVCVSLVDSTYYAQALLSNVGYMRGTIDSSTDIWTGSYWIAGYEAIQGSFTLSLDTSGATNTYSASYTQSPGYTYTSTGSQTSTSTPTNLECFKSDDSLLTSGVYTDYLTGAWFNDLASDADPWYLSAVEDTGATSSYIYEYSLDLLPGTSFGPIYHYGQVSLDNWYEPGSDEGIELIVAKNSTAMYNLWWFYTRSADFNYTTNADYFAANLNLKDTSVSTSTVTALSEEYMCYALWTTEAEDNCLSGNDDDDDDVMLTQDFAIAATVFAVLGFLSVLGLCVVVLVGKKEPMSNQTSSSTEARL